MNRGGVARLAVPTAAAGLVAFALLAVAAASGHGAPLPADHALYSWSVRHRPEVAVASARGLTYTGTGVIPYLLAALAGLVAGRGTRQRLLACVASLCCLALCQTLRYTVMTLAERPRPPVAGWATHATGWSFPSGHTTTSAVTAGLLITAVLLRAPRNGRTLAIGIGCWGVLVGLTRIYLGVHWFTDVIGGWLFGISWLSLTVRPALRLLPGTAVRESAEQGGADRAATADPGRR